MLESIATVWARLAYMKNTDFLVAYKTMFEDSVIITEWSDPNKKNEIKNHMTIKTLMENISNDSSYLNNFIPFLPLAQKINVILGEDARAKKTGWIINNRTEESTNCHPKFVIPIPNDKENLIFTSISTSNYSGCYVFADIRMPNIIVVSFRGTYSTKAAGSFMQPKYYVLNSIIDKDNIKVLTGIYKIMIEMVHTILNTIEDIKKQLQEKTKSTKEIKVIVTGHSLGGALATLFSYVYMKTTTIKKDKMCCISLGAPRVFNTAAAINFCNMCTNQKLFEYRRLTTTNDPITIMPLTSVIGITSGYTADSDYQHPCSDKTQVSVREEIFRDCFPQVSNSASTRCASTSIAKNKFAMTSNYDLPLNCTKKNKGWYKSSFYFKSPMSYHGMYLGILFMGGIDPFLFISSNLGKQDLVEINRFNNNKDTACKLSCYDGKDFNIAFFNLTHFRKKNGLFREDVYVTKENYATIKSKLKKYETTQENEDNINSLIPGINPIESTNPNEPFEPTGKDSSSSGSTNIKETELTSLADAPADAPAAEAGADAPAAAVEAGAAADAPAAEAEAGAEAAAEAPAAEAGASDGTPAADAPAAEAAADAPAAEAEAGAEAPAAEAEAGAASDGTPAADAPAAEAEAAAEADAPAAEAPAAEAAAEAGEGAAADADGTPAAEAGAEAEEQTKAITGGAGVFPAPNVTEEFLLKVETFVKQKPIEDPSEVLTEEEMKSIQTVVKSSSDKSEKESKNESGQSGGRRTKHIKKKRKKTKKRKIKLYL